MTAALVELSALIVRTCEGGGGGGRVRWRKRRALGAMRLFATARAALASRADSVVVWWKREGRVVCVFV